LKAPGVSLVAVWDDGPLLVQLTLPPALMETEDKV
jgi:hypothetical protein